VRRLIQTPHGVRWGCSDCAWEYIPPGGPPMGETLEEMKKNFLDARDREFDAHDCSKYPR